MRRIAGAGQATTRLAPRPSPSTPGGAARGGAFDARTISPVASHPCSRAAAVSKAGRVTSAKSNRLAMSGGEGVRYFSSRRHAMPSHACQPSRIAGDILKSAWSSSKMQLCDSCSTKLEPAGKSRCSRSCTRRTHPGARCRRGPRRAVCRCRRGPCRWRYSSRRRGRPGGIPRAARAR